MLAVQCWLSRAGHCPNEAYHKYTAIRMIHYQVPWNAMQSALIASNGATKPPWGLKDDGGRGWRELVGRELMWIRGNGEKQFQAGRTNVRPEAFEWDILRMQEAKRRPWWMKYGDGLGSLVGDGAIKTEKSWVTLGFPGHTENFGYHPKNNRMPSKSVSKRRPRSDLDVTSITLATVLQMPQERQA